MAKLQDMEIIAQVELEESMAYGVNDSSLSNDRADAIDYYLGQPFGNEEEGRSQVISYDVQDTIESALPQLLKVFVAGDKVVQFDPKGPEDQDAAEQETDYVNHVVMEKNEGFKTFYVWFKDALLSKNGYVKVYSEDEEEVEESKTVEPVLPKQVKRAKKVKLPLIIEGEEEEVTLEDLKAIVDDLTERIEALEPDEEEGEEGDMEDEEGAEEEGAEEEGA